MSKNLIVGCSGTELSKKEKALFTKLQPWGIILFSRNISSPEQTVRLIDDIKHALGRDELIVLIDQEGGRVSRLPATHWRVPPSPLVFARMFTHNSEDAIKACWLNAQLTGLELKALGINVNCVPMLDLPHANTATIISERALGETSQQVIELATQICEGHKSVGVAPVIKHMPGHGRAQNDSHKELPYIDASLNELIAHDFVPFKALNEEVMAMSAHLVFTQLDSKNAATVSKAVVSQVMREAIGFNGLIMTDDINMHALEGSIASRASRSIAAGCDIALHCSGDLDEMYSLIEVVSELEGKSLARAKNAEALAFKSSPDIDEQEIKTELTQLLKPFI